MKKASRHNPIGTLPMDKGVCALLQDKQGNMICEAYMYRVGFFRFNWHPSLEIMFVMQGNLRIFTQRGTYLLKEGDIIVHFSQMQEHAYNDGNSRHNSCGYAYFAKISGGYKFVCTAYQVPVRQFKRT